MQGILGSCLLFSEPWADEQTQLQVDRWMAHSGAWPRGLRHITSHLCNVFFILDAGKMVINPPADLALICSFSLLKTLNPLTAKTKQEHRCTHDISSILSGNVSSPRSQMSWGRLLSRGEHLPFLPDAALLPSFLVSRFRCLFFSLYPPLTDN